MRLFQTLLACLATTLIFGQSLSDKYLHFRRDSYWDTILYKSEQAYYCDLTNGKITQKDYPVLNYLFTRIISDTPFVAIDTFERLGWSRHPYKYIRKGNNIYLQYFDLGKRKLKLNREYSLDPKDTVEGLAGKSSLDSKYGISVDGFSTYLGEDTIEINGEKFKTYRFLEDHERGGSHPSYYTIEVCLDQKLLIPIKFVGKAYDYKTKKMSLYHSITILDSSSNSLEDYSNKTTDDLILYENKNVVWSNQQKDAFLNMYASYNRQYIECLLKKLDGHISFFHFKRNHYFISLLVNKECE